MINIVQQQSFGKDKNMTREEYAKKLVKEKYSMYNLTIPFEKLPWSGELIETKLNDGTVELVDRLVEFTLCSLHSYYYIDRYAWTMPPKGGEIPFKLFDFQKHALNLFQTNQKIIFRKCLTENNFVLTNRGYISIKDVKINDKVYSSKGFINIEDWWKNKEKKLIIEIKLNNGSIIECTQDHKIMTDDSWKEAKDLNKNDKIITTFNKIDFGNFELEDDRLAIILGYYMADGKARENCFVNTNINYINEIIECGKFFEDIKVKINKRKKTKKHHLQAYDVRFTSYRGNNKKTSFGKFKERFGINKNSKHRIFTKEIMELNKEQMSLFLNRFFAGDGYVMSSSRKGGNGVKYPNHEIGVGVPNEILAHQICHILRDKYGIHCSLTEMKNCKGQKNRFWKCRIYDNDSILKFIDDIGIYDKDDINIERKYKSKQNSNKIKSIKQLDLQTTYDITTESSDFYANGCLVHNCRQIGASVVSGCYALWRANFHKAQSIKIISLGKSDAIEFKEKTIDLSYEYMPGFLKSKTKGQSRLSKTKLELTNRSSVKVASQSKNAGRGGTPSLVILDEAAFNVWMDDIWKSIFPSLDKGGDCIVISTTNGVGNWYHQTYTRAEQKLNDFTPIYIPWWRYPGRDNPWLDDVVDKINTGKITEEEVNKFTKQKEREQLGYKGDPQKAPWLWKMRANSKSEKDFDQEILAKFLGTGETVITGKTINELENNIKEPKWIDQLPNVILKKPIPGLWCWEDANPNNVYALSADVARGDGKDFSAFQIYNMNDCKQVAEYKNTIGTKGFGKLIKQVARHFNNAYVMIETTGLGIAVFNEVYMSDTDPYQNVYAINKGKAIISWETSSRTRPLMIDDFFNDIESEYTKMFSERFVEEVKVFNWSEKGKPEAMTGYNDDLVISHSIFCHLKDHVLTSRPLGISTNKTSATDPIGELNELKFVQMDEKFNSMFGMDYGEYCWVQGKKIPDEYIQYKKSLKAAEIEYYNISTQ